MAEIGKLNNLRVVKEVEFGVYLDGENEGEILLPIKQVPKGTKPGDALDVFIYKDSEDRIIATTEKPLAMVGDFALLRVVAVDRVGAFLDWGLMKDLLVPYREQKRKMEKGRSYVVYIYLDEESERIAATAKLEKFLDNTKAEYLRDEEVDLLIHSKTEMGYKAIINNSHSGVLYHNEIFQELHIGQRIKGFVRKIREDEKIDLYLNKQGYENIDEISQNIIFKLKENNNFLPVTDKSNPEIIYLTFSISKKNFKKAIGSLYKNRLIKIETDGIRFIG